MRATAMLLLVLLLASPPTEVLTTRGEDHEAQQRWSEEQAQQWGASRQWRIGANYLPSRCANVIDMFDTDHFDAILLDVEREMRVAQASGFSAVRIFLHEELYFQRKHAFLEDVSRLLDVLRRRHVSVMFVLFDACWRPDLENANPIPGVHNSAWVQSPTHSVLGAYAAGDTTAVERLRAYVTAVVGRFANDELIVAWDIYNEPSMRESEHWILPRLAASEGWDRHPPHWLLSGKKMHATFKLLEDAFGWARSVNPSQPLTTAVWDFPNADDDIHVEQFKLKLNDRLIGMSDVLSLHCYCEPQELESRITRLSALQRGPVFVTEFMARSRNSTIVNSMPVLQHYGAWGYTWGLFRGRSQTHRPWDTWIRDDVAHHEEWFHDVFHENGSAYDADEVKTTWWYGIGSRLGL